MKCFDVARRVLDSTFGEIEGTEEEQYMKISNAISSMSDQYANIVANGGPDFRDPVTRFAYVYKYMTAHAHWLFELIGRSEDATQLFVENTKLRVTCLGGGPGSDLVGILKYIASRNLNTSLMVEIVDGCIDWKSTWSDLAYEIDWQETLHTDYIIHDVGNPETWTAPSKFEKTDLFTMSFFASEVKHLKEQATDYFKNVLRRAKPGAVVLVNDNDSPVFHEWMDELADATGMVVKEKLHEDRKIFDLNEQKTVLAHYADRLNHQPRLTGRVFSRVYVKA